jgi:hypothetical protein
MGKQDETGTVDAFSGVCGMIIMYQIWLSHRKVWIYDARVPQRQNTFSDLVTKTGDRSITREADIHHTTPLSTLLSKSTTPDLSRHPPWTRREDRVRTRRARR